MSDLKDADLTCQEELKKLEEKKKELTITVRLTTHFAEASMQSALG